MTADQHEAETIFLEAARDAIAERAGRVSGRRPAATIAELRQRVEALLQAHDEPASFLAGTAAGIAATIDQPPTRNDPARRSAPTSCCSRSAKGAWASSSWPSRHEPVAAARGAQDHQAGHGHAAGDRPLRGRAAGAGDDGPSEHRQGARRRARPTAAGRTSSWSWSRACRSPSTATSNTSRRASGWSCSCRSARRSSTPIRRGSSTATSSRRTCWSPSTTAGRCPR